MVKKGKTLYYGCAGCAVVLFLFLAVLAGGIGYISYQGYQFSKEIGVTYKGLITDYQNLDRQYAFTPPPDGLLDPGRLEDFVNVRVQLAEFSKQYQDNLEKAGDAVGKQFDQPGILSKLRGVTRIRELVDMAVKIGAGIGQEHIRLLNDKAMSVQEYRWYTQTCLSTLSQSKENQFEPGAQFWEEYLKLFEAARELKNVHINLDEQGLGGGEINRENLLKKLVAVPYQAQNAALLQPFLDRFLPAGQVTVLDYLTLYYDEILDHFGKDQ